ncbi:MAG: DUF507 family protein [Myxococcales bacterium FL481]|nr:MAG: DUF507 family protein [Myxococcales bacterium FL481]
MRLFSAKIPTVVDALVRNLVDSGDLEVSDLVEFKSDVESILREYLRKERELTEGAKDLLEARGLNYSELHRTRRAMAEQQDFGLGEDAPNWIASQLLQLFMASQFVEEIYADDQALRGKIRALLARSMQADDDLDREVRRHLKHLAEGTESFEIEYQKQLDRVRRRHGLS